MRVLIFIAFLSFATSSFAQSKDEIKEKGIESRKYYEQEIEEGDKEMYLFKEEYFNEKGEVVEVKTYENKGKDLEEWFKYKYDEKGNLVEELELDKNGEQIEKVVSVFENGLKVEKLYYDEKNRLRQKREYEYGYRK